MITNDRQLLLASSVFLLLFSLEKDNTKKATRKKIVRQIKRCISIYRNTNINKKQYLSLVEDSSAVIKEVQDLMTLKQVEKSKLNRINPYQLLKVLSVKVPELYDCLEIDNRYLEDFKEGYKGVELTFVTTMFVNRIVKLIKERDLNNLTVTRFKNEIVTSTNDKPLQLTPTVLPNIDFRLPTTIHSSI